jgi:hypothetical protein
MPCEEIERIIAGEIYFRARFERLPGGTDHRRCLAALGDRYKHVALADTRLSELVSSLSPEYENPKRRKK